MRTIREEGNAEAGVTLGGEWGTPTISTFWWLKAEISWVSIALKAWGKQQWKGWFSIFFFFFFFIQLMLALFLSSPNGQKHVRKDIFYITPQRNHGIQFCLNVRGTDIQFWGPSWFLWYPNLVDLLSVTSPAWGFHLKQDLSAKPKCKTSC